MKDLVNKESGQRTGYYSTKPMEIGIMEPEDFCNFLGMDAQSFDQLLSLVEPWVRKERHSDAFIHSTK